MAYTSGLTTFIAGTDLQAHRLIAVSPGTVTNPPEVVYATDPSLIGFSRSNAKAGEPIAVAPFTTNGTVDATCVIDTAITYGTSLYLSAAGGTITDDGTSNIFVGISLTDAASSGDIVTYSSVVGSIGSFTASDIVIDDAGGYYTSGNVEGALQEIGSNLTRTRTVIAPYTDFREMIDGFTAKNLANAAGHPASDSADLPVSSVGAGMSTFHHMTATGTGAGYYVDSIVEFSLPYTIDKDEDITVGIIGWGTVSSNWTMTVGTNWFLTDDFPEYATGSDTPSVTGTLAYIPIHTITGGTLSAAVYGMMMNLRLANDNVETLNIAGAYLTFKTFF